MDYDYREEVKNDVLDYIKENLSLDDMGIDEFNAPRMKNRICEQILGRSGEITGADSGSYTCNSYRAAEYLAHNWNLLEEALAEFGYSSVNPIAKGPEWCDVLIREYLIPSVINEVVDEVVDEYVENLPDDDEN